MTFIKKSLILSILLVSALTLSACGGKNTAPVATLDNSEVPSNHVEALRQNFGALDKTKQPQTELDKVVELSDNGSIYYFAANGKRYIFPTQDIFKSWFGTYKPEKVMALEEMQKVPLGGNVTVRPGSLISTPSDSNIYLVKQNGVISPVEKSVLKRIFGDYAQRVLEIPNYYFTNYEYGDKIESDDDFPFTDITLTIDQDKGLDATQN